jgi:hypothetical protein
MGDRLLGPQVIETHSEVLIAFAAIPRTGSQECPSNLVEDVTLTLSAPLGDRHIRDGLVVPINLAERLG